MCCDHLTMHLIPLNDLGKQCMTSRWCKVLNITGTTESRSCVDAVKKDPLHGQLQDASRRLPSAASVAASAASEDHPAASSDVGPLLQREHQHLWIQR